MENAEIYAIKVIVPDDQVSGRSGVVVVPDAAIIDSVAFNYRAGADVRRDALVADTDRNMAVRPEYWAFGILEQRINQLGRRQDCVWVDFEGTVEGIGLANRGDRYRNSGNEDVI